MKERQLDSALHKGLKARTAREPNQIKAFMKKNTKIIASLIAAGTFAVTGAYAGSYSTDAKSFDMNKRTLGELPEYSKSASASQPEFLRKSGRNDRKIGTDVNSRDNDSIYTSSYGQTYAIDQAGTKSRLNSTNQISGRNDRSVGTEAPLFDTRSFSSTQASTRTFNYNIDNTSTWSPSESYSTYSPTSATPNSASLDSSIRQTDYNNRTALADRMERMMIQDYNRHAGRVSSEQRMKQNALRSEVASFRNASQRDFETSRERLANSYSDYINSQSRGVVSQSDSGSGFTSGR